MYRMLQNPIYAGFFFVQGERYELDRKLPRIITEKELNKISQILGSRCNPKVQKHEAIFSGFIKSDTGDFMGQDVKHQLWCDCGHKFAYRNKNNCPKCDKKIDELENPEYFVQSYYYNNRKKKAGLEYHSIKEEVVIENVISFITENLEIPQELVSWSKKYIHEIKDVEVYENLKTSEDKEIRKEQYESKKKNAIRLFIEGKIDEEEKKSFVSDLDKSYADLKENTIDKVSWVEKLEDILYLTANIKDVISNGGFEAKRSILTRLGSHWVWNDKELLISNKESINTFINGIKTVKPILSEFGNQKALVMQGLNDDNSSLCISLRYALNKIRTFFEENPEAEF